MAFDNDIVTGMSGSNTRIGQLNTCSYQQLLIVINSNFRNKTDKL
jgi:hypothetical protein